METPSPEAQLPVTVDHADDTYLILQRHAGISPCLHVHHMM